ncbi:hypothetical protein BH11MYX4_BH11MYX4_25640 [soil metagenome]
MNRHPLLTLAALVPLVACAATASDETVGTVSQPLCRLPGGCIIVGGPTLPPIVTAVPAVTVQSSDLNFNIQTLLRGSLLSVDTTGSAPQRFGPPKTYPNPVFVQCQQDRSACGREPIYLRAECLAEVNERCAGVPHSISTSEIQHSYLAFGPVAKSHNAEDIFFPIQTMHHDDAVFSFDIDINYIHAELGYNLTAGFIAGPSSRPAAWLSLTGIQSNSPTIILGGDIPDFELGNMAARVTLADLAPTGDKLGVDYTSVSSTFTFDWNANNTPDVLVSAFLDVNQLVQNRVSARVNTAFNAPKTHAAISSALTDLVNREILKVSPAGYSSISEVESDSNGIRVTYVPK